MRTNTILLIAAVMIAAAPLLAAADQKNVALKPKVLVVNYDPIVKSAGGKRLHDICGWSDPHKLAARYIQDIEKASGGLVKYRIVKWMDRDEYPVKLDGFRYTEKSYMACRKGEQKWHQPDACDYKAMIESCKMAELVSAGKVDEVWMFGAPYFGWFESCMAGPGAFWINGTPLPEVKCKRAFAIMGFNYERGPGEMLEDLGHRTESTMSKVFGGWRAGLERNDWEKFTLYEHVAPGKSACGSVHWAPNSSGDYDWGNKAKVWSTCDDWLNYPNLTGKKKLVDCSEWGGGDIEKHHIWWFTHLPKAPGKTGDKYNNWWLYVIDFNKYVIAAGL